MRISLKMKPPHTVTSLVWYSTFYVATLLRSTCRIQFKVHYSLHSW